MRFLKLLFICAFLAVLAVPGTLYVFGMHSRVMPDEPEDYDCHLPKLKAFVKYYRLSKRESDPVRSFGDCIMRKLPGRAAYLSTAGELNVRLLRDPSVATRVYTVPGTGAKFLLDSFSTVCKYGTDATPSLARLDRIDQLLRASGRRLFLVIGPNKLSIMPEYGDQALLKYDAYCAAKLRATLIQELSTRPYAPRTDYWTLVRDHARTNPNLLAYVPDDTHWTDWGAYPVAEAAMRFFAGNAWDDLQVTYETKWIEGASTFKSMTHETHPWPIAQVARPGLTTTHKFEQPDGYGDLGVRILETRSNGAAPAPTRRLLVISDSFIDGLIPYLGPFFSEVRIIHWRQGEMDVFRHELETADDVLFVCLEREFEEEMLIWISKHQDIEKTFGNLPSPPSANQQLTR